jgi:hypothetical protein
MLAEATKKVQQKLKGSDRILIAVVSRYIVNILFTHKHKHFFFVLTTMKMVYSLKQDTFIVMFCYRNK